MDKQPKGQSPVEALRLADLEAMHERGTIRRGHIDEMLTELRRLYALNKELLEALRKCSAQLTRLGYSANHADAAIAKAKEQT